MAADYSHGWDEMTEGQMWAKMRTGWKSGETPCGTGSEIGKTAEIRRWLPEILDSVSARSLVDVGAGDLNWIRQALPKGLNYTALDLVPRHYSVVQFDITKQVPPRADVVLCRFVLNHLSVRLALDALRNIVASGSPWLLITNWPAQTEYWRAYGYELPLPMQWFTDSNETRIELHDVGALGIPDAD